MTITLQETLRGAFYAPFYAAFALGAYEAEGVSVELASAPKPSDAAKGLGEGSVDVTWGGPLRVMLMRERDGLDLVGFCEVATRDPFFVVGREPRPDFRPADLCTVRFASVSEVPTPWLCLQEDVRRDGGDPDRIDRVSDRGMGENCAALRRGEIDAIQLFQPYVEELVESGAGHVWSAAADRGPCSYTTFYARRDVLTARQDELRRMVRAIYRTQKWLHGASGAEIARTVAPYFPDVPQSRLAAAYDRYKALGIWGRDPILPRGGFERLRAGMISGGFVRAGASYEDAVDNALAEEIMREDPPAMKSLA